MAISRPPKISEADEDALFQKYIGKAPEDNSSQAAELSKEAKPQKEERPKETRRPEHQKKKARKGKQPITITIAPELLRKVDASAAEKGMSRAAYIAMALSYAVDHGIFK
jgi:predicted DNA binding CopG/RHH family protein